MQASDTVSIEAGTLDNIGTGKYTGIPSVFLPLPCITMWMRIKKRHWKSTGTSGNGETGHGKALEDLAAVQGPDPQGSSPEAEAAESVYLAKKKLSWHCKSSHRHI